MAKAKDKDGDTAAKDEAKKGGDQRLAKLLDVATKAKAAYGGHMVQMASTLRRQDRLLGGSVSLDNVLGGGLVRGLAHIFWGEYSGGKTTHMLRYMAKGQGICRHCWRPVPITVEPIDYGGEPPQGAPTHHTLGYCDCVASGYWVPRKLRVVDGTGKLREEKDEAFAARIAALKVNSYAEFVVACCDLEGTFDPAWATLLGVDLRRLWFFRPGYGEQAVDLVESMLRTGQIDLLGVDSLAMLSPSSELDVSAEEQQQGVQARLTNKAIRKWVLAINDVWNECRMAPTQIWIQQVRQKIGLHGGNTMPGGKGQLFAAAIEIYCYANKPEVEEIIVGANKEETATRPIKVKLNFRAEKNKTAVPHKTGFYWMGLEPHNLGQVLEVDFILAACMRFGIVVDASGTYTVGVNTYKTQKAVKEHWQQDPLEAMRVAKLLLEKLRTVEPMQKEKGAKAEKGSKAEKAEKAEKADEEQHE